MQLYLGIDMGKSGFTAALCSEYQTFQIVHPEVRNQIEGWQAIIQTYQKQIEKVQAQIHKHIDSHPNLHNQSDLLQSIPGIGEKISAILLCECIPALTPKQQMAYADLVPRHNQSGKMNGKTHNPNYEL